MYNGQTFACFSQQYIDGYRQSDTDKLISWHENNVHSTNTGFYDSMKEAA